MALALILHNGVASGNLIDAHIIVSIYSFPDLDLGNGPTKSVFILLNGSSKAAIGFNGTF